MRGKYHTRRPICVILFLLLAVSASGCGKTSTVTGKVTYHGRTVTHGSVIFLNSDGTAHTGVIQPDGAYAVEEEPRGSARIAIISRDPTKGRSILRQQQPAPRDDKRGASRPAGANGWFPLPLEFEDPKQSGLSCEVASRRVTHDIELR